MKVLNGSATPFAKWAIPNQRNKKWTKFNTQLVVARPRWVSRWQECQVRCLRGFKNLPLPSSLSISLGEQLIHWREALHGTNCLVFHYTRIFHAGGRFRWRRAPLFVVRILCAKGNDEIACSFSLLFFCIHF